MKNFIYVFCDADKEKLIKAGYVLMKEDIPNRTYVFLSDDRLLFALSDISYITTDTLSF